MRTSPQWNDFSGEISTTSFGPRLNIFHRFTQALAYNGSLMLLRQDFDDEYRDGWRLNADGRLARTFATDLTGFVSGGVERGLTDDRADLRILGLLWRRRRLQGNALGHLDDG